MGNTIRGRKSITHSLLHLLHSLSHSCLGPACATPRLAPHAGASVHASPHAETLDGPKQPIPAWGCALAWDHAGAPDPSQYSGKFSGACGRPPRARAYSPEQPAPIPKAAQPASGGRHILRAPHAAGPRGARLSRRRAAVTARRGSGLRGRPLRAPAQRRGRAEGGGRVGAGCTALRLRLALAIGAALRGACARR